MKNESNSTCIELLLLKNENWKSHNGHTWIKLGDEKQVFT